MGRVGRVGLVVGTAHQSANGHGKKCTKLTFVDAARYVDDKAELARRIMPVDVGEANKNLVFVDTLYSAPHTFFKLRDFRIGFGSMVLKGCAFSVSFYSSTRG